MYVEMYAAPPVSAGEYDEGLTQLSMVRDSSPLVLLRLVPDLVPDKFRGKLPQEAAGVKLPGMKETGER